MRGGIDNEDMIRRLEKGHANLQEINLSLHLQLNEANYKIAKFKLILEMIKRHPDMSRSIMDSLYEVQKEEDGR